MLRGLSAFPLTPVGRDGVDDVAFVRLIDRLVAAGVDSIGALGSTGSYMYLDRAERARIAREMHDVLAHRVSLIALQAGALEVNAGAASGTVERAAAEIRSTAHETLEDLRGVLGVLRGADAEPLAPQPDLADLSRLVEQSRVGGATVDLRIDEAAAAPHAVPEALGRTAYRIVQESLTNVRKHAGPAAVRVAVTLREHRLAIEVINDRPRSPAPPLPGSGAGLIGLAERVQLAGGELTSGPTAAGGWRVHADLPVPAERT